MAQVEAVFHWLVLSPALLLREQRLASRCSPKPLSCLQRLRHEIHRVCSGLPISLEQIGPRRKISRTLQYEVRCLRTGSKNAVTIKRWNLANPQRRPTISLRPEMISSEEQASQQSQTRKAAAHGYRWLTSAAAPGDWCRARRETDSRRWLARLVRLGPDEV